MLLPLLDSGRLNWPAFWPTCRFSRAAVLHGHLHPLHGLAVEGGAADLDAGARLGVVVGGRQGEDQHAALVVGHRVEHQVLGLDVQRHGLARRHRRQVAEQQVAGRAGEQADGRLGTGHLGELRQVRPQLVVAQAAVGVEGQAGVAAAVAVAGAEVFHIAVGQATQAPLHRLLRHRARGGVEHLHAIDRALLHPRLGGVVAALHGLEAQLVRRLGQGHGVFAAEGLLADAVGELHLHAEAVARQRGLGHAQVTAVAVPVGAVAATEVAGVLAQAVEQLLALAAHQLQHAQAQAAGIVQGVEVVQLQGDQATVDATGRQAHLQGGGIRRAVADHAQGLCREFADLAAAVGQAHLERLVDAAGDALGAAVLDAEAAVQAGAGDIVVVGEAVPQQVDALQADVVAGGQLDIEATAFDHLGRQVQGGDLGEGVVDHGDAQLGAGHVAGAVTHLDVVDLLAKAGGGILVAQLVLAEGHRHHLAVAHQRGLVEGALLVRHLGGDGEG